MHLSLPASRALVAVTGLLGLVDAQGFFSPAIPGDSACQAEGFVFQACFATTDAEFADYNYFTPVEFTPGTTPPLDRSFYGYSFEGGNAYDNTVTPLNCARVCRAYGFRITALRSGECHCGTQIPDTPGGGGDCLLPCPGDFGQTCGGTDGQVQYYYDQSFAAPTSASGSPNAGLASSYQYLGCYRIGTGTLDDPYFIPADPRLPLTQPPQTSAENCFSVCAGYGYPLASAERVAAGEFQCRCGTTFSNNDYRVNPDSIGQPTECTTSCSTGGSSLLCTGTNKCCAVTGSVYAPVYINPLLLGCYKPVIPGFKDSESDRTFECYDIPASLLSSPAGTVKPAAVEPAARTLSPSQTALARPPTVVATVPAPRTYYLLGCYQPAGILGFAGLIDTFLFGSVTVNSLQECANVCNNPSILGFPVPVGNNIFGVANSNQCYCGTTPLAGLTAGNRVFMGGCNQRCPSSPGTACGGTNRILLYIGTQEDATGYNSYSSSYLAATATRPVYSCIPSVVSATATTTATTTSVVSVTETVAGSVVTISGERVTLTATIASVTRTETLTVTTPYFATLTFTSVNSTVLVTELRSTTYTTVRTLIDPAATLVRNVTLIDAGSTRTLIDAGATRTVVETFTRDGTTVTRTVTGVSQGTGPVAECYDEGCTLSLRYGALRLPAATPAGAVCRIKTESWVYSATTLLP